MPIKSAMARPVSARAIAGLLAIRVDPTLAVRAATGSGSRRGRLAAFAFVGAAKVMVVTGIGVVEAV